MPTSNNSEVSSAPLICSLLPVSEVALRITLPLASMLNRSAKLPTTPSGLVNNPNLPAPLLMLVFTALIAAGTAALY